MRLKLAAVLMILLCLLTACGGKESDVLQAPMDFRASLLEAGGCSFSASISADYGDSVNEFTVFCECMTDGTAHISVTAPDSIAGIEAELSDCGKTLVFGETAVAFATLANGNLAPVCAPSVLTAAWTSAYIRSSGNEADTVRTTYEYGYDEELLIADCWFNEKMIPICAEFCYNDKTILKMEITDFSFVSGGDHETSEENMGGYFAR